MCQECNACVWATWSWTSVAPRCCQVLTEREERNSIAIASSEPFSGWTKTLTDPRLCAAIVDRRTFGGNIIETGTESYRLAHTRAKADRGSEAILGPWFSAEGSAPPHNGGGHDRHGSAFEASGLSARVREHGLDDPGGGDRHRRRRWRPLHRPHRLRLGLGHRVRRRSGGDLGAQGRR